MNTPTVVLLIAAACWPIWATLHTKAGERLQRGSFAYQVTDDVGQVLERGTAGTYADALELAEVAAARLRGDT